MADRNVYGHDFSENGWRMVDEGSCRWIAVPGTAVTIQVREGQPVAVMGALVADLNAYVQKVRDADTACWTRTNSVATSNHLSGTAVDVDWDDHPMGPEYAGWSPEQIATIREILDFYEEMVFWGEDWRTPKDSMHFQMGYDTYGSENVDRVNSFIARKIRADGFSTFRRGNAPAPLPTATAANVLAQATGLSVARATTLLPGITGGLHAAQCTNPRRIAMFIAQTQEESANYDTTTEYASGAEYEGRCSDLGNCSPGDGVRYKGRTYIQITGKFHYEEFSQWAFDQGLTTSPTQFVDDPVSLGDLHWAGIGAAWYWVVARPAINGMCDAGDVVGVTKAINGGTHGLDVRQANYARAIALGDQLLALITAEEDDMAQVPQDQWDRVFRELTQLLTSRSPLRHLGEGPLDTMAGFVLNTDGSQHVEVCRLLAGYGHPPTIALLQEVANADPVQYPDRQEDAKMAQAILAETTSSPVAPSKAPQVAQVTNPVPQKVVYVDRPLVDLPVTKTPAVAQDPPVASTAGQLIGQAYDALAALPADLSTTEKASLTALMGVLQSKTEGATK